MSAPTVPSASDESAFEIFDLTVSLGPDARPWVTAASQAGFVHGVPRGGAGLPLLPELLDAVYDYADAVQFMERDHTPPLSIMLGELVFGDAMVKQLFQATRGVAAHRGRQLLVRILASPHLAVLPWELLPDPGAPRDGRSHRYLALAPDAHVVRLARGRSYASRPRPLEPPLNLLLVLSSPTPRDHREDWLAFDIFEVKRNLLLELQPLVDAGFLHIDVEDSPTAENLRRRVGAQRRGYHLFHFVGHAAPDRLVLEDRAGRREDMSSARFVELLRLCPDLRLALFAGCETARAARDPSSLQTGEAVGWRDLLSLADYTVQEACPAVIGMQAVLPLSTERVLTRFFYQALASGYSIAEALRLARGAIESDERLGSGLMDWSVPTLFVGGSEPGALLRRAATPAVVSPRRRADVKLGLRQRAQRFFARDLPLRQTVEILSQRTGDRVVVITGAARAETSAFVDRSLEELGDAVERVLYVHLDRLLPEVVEARRVLDAGEAPNLGALGGIPADAAVANLCRLAEELLRLEGGTSRQRDAAWSANEWWERLVEDLCNRRVALVVDDVGSLDALERELLRALLGQQLALDDSPIGSTDLESHLAALEQVDDARDLPAEDPVTGWLEAQRRGLGPLPRRLHPECTAVLCQLAERVLLRSRIEQVADLRSLWSSSAGPLGAAESAQLRLALAQMDGIRTRLGRALTCFAERRTARVVLTAVASPRALLDLPGSEVFEMRLAPLTWPETWRWIRRNLHGLVGFGDEVLSRVWLLLGDRLDSWEELERVVVRARAEGTTEPPSLREMVASIAPRLARQGGGAAGLQRHRAERPLRIAAASGRFVVRGVAEAMTRLASEHGIGGRVVLDDAGDAGALATLLDEPSPFDSAGGATAAGIAEWLASIGRHQPDIVLLDYGWEVQPSDLESAHPHRRAIRNLRYTSLLIAAGGNEPGAIVAPGVYEEVLAVGPLDANGQLREYATWTPERAKPDIFMTDDLEGTPLAAALDPATFGPNFGQLRGSSFSALHAVACAALVWGILPQCGPQGVRALMIEAAEPIFEGAPTPRKLTMERALFVARRRVVFNALREGPCSLSTLAAITGLDVRVLAGTVEPLLRSGQLRVLPGRLDRLELVGRLEGTNLS
jgi:hypothetical protein